MKDCTFNPSLNRNSLTIADKTTYSFREKQQETENRKFMRVKELKKTKEEKELEECTFQPKLVTKKPRNKTPKPKKEVI
jgi:hypothetical protein